MEFKRRAVLALPGRIGRVVLFGSRARGDANPDSDWDVAVFLTGEPDASDRRALADAAYDLIEESGEFIQPLALALDEADGELQLLRRIREEGVTL